MPDVLSGDDLETLRARQSNDADVYQRQGELAGGAPQPGTPIESQAGFAAGQTFARAPKEPPPWEEVKDDFTGAFPDQDPAMVKRRYEQARELRRVRRADDDRGDSYIERFGRQLAQRMPWSSYAFSASDNHIYRQAQQRYNQGDATPEDLSRIAEYERHQREDAASQESVGGIVGQGLLRMPAMAAEWMGGGAVLKAAGIGAPGLLAGSSWAGARAAAGTLGRQAAFMAVNPSFYVPEWQENNRAAGRDLMDVRGLPTALGMGFMNSAVLGMLGQHFNGFGGEGLPGVLARNAGRTGAGLLEMEASNTVGALLGWRTRYGNLTELLTGDDKSSRESARGLVGDIASLVAFNFLHEGGSRSHAADQVNQGGSPEAGAPTGPEPRGPEPTPRSPEDVRQHPVIVALGDALEHLQRFGMSKEAALNATRAIMTEYKRAVASNPNLTAADVRQLFERTGNSYLRNLGMAIADAHGEITASNPRQTPPQTPQPEPQAQPQTAQQTAQGLIGGREARPLEAPNSHSGAESGQIPTSEPQNTAQGQGEAPGRAWLEAYGRERRGEASHEAAAREASKAGDQHWQNSGTEFRDNPDGHRFDYTGSDGQTYTINQYDHAPNEAWGEHGGHSVHVVNQAGEVVATASFKKDGEGILRGDVKFNTRDGERLAPKGVGRAIYDYAQRAIGDIKPENTLHKSEAGKLMWQQNAERASGVPPGTPGTIVERMRARQAGLGGVTAPTAAPVTGEARPGVRTEALPQREIDRREDATKDVLRRAAELGAQQGLNLAPTQAEKLAEMRARAKATGWKPSVPREEKSSAKEKRELDESFKASGVELHARLLDTRNPLPEDASRVVDVLGRLADLAEKRGLDPLDLIEKRMPELTALVGRETLGEMIAVTKEPDDDAHHTKRLSLSPASFRRVVEQQVQKDLANAQADAQGQRGAQPAQRAGARPTQVGGAGAQAGGAASPPPAADRGQAGGDQLTSLQKAQLARTTNPWMREVLLRRFAGDGPLADKIKAAGGLNPEHFPGGAAGKEAQAWRENFGDWIFQDKSGRKGRAKWDQLMDPAGEVGASIPPVPDDRHPLDHLHDLLAAHATVDGERYLNSRRSLEELKHYEDQARGQLAAENPTWTEEEINRNLEEIRRASQEAGEGAGSRSAPQEVIQDARANQKPAGAGDAYEPPADRTKPGTNPNNPTDGWSDSARRAAGEWLRDESGTLDPNKIQGWLADKWQQLKRAGEYIADNYRELAGHMFPRVTKRSQASGEAMARFIASRNYARVAAPVYIDKVMGPNATTADRLLAGAVLTERRLRYMRQYFIRTGNMDAARKVTSIIGQDGSPLKTLDDYRRALTSPMIDGVMRRWNNEFVPVMEDNYRRAQGLEDTDPIHSPTQIPGSPVNIKAVQPGDEGLPSVIATGPGGRGNLKNVRLRKFVFAESATGAAEGYDVDLGGIIENSLAKGFGTAAKAEMARTMVAEGVARWGKPGTQIEGSKEVPWVNPPPGTQENQKGQTSLYIDAAGYDEMRQALQVDKPLHIPFVTDVAPVLNAATLMSTVEMAYHSKNMLTMLMKPGIRPQDFVRNIVGVWTKDPKISDRLVELARIGASKEHGHGVGLGASPYNPLHWGARALELLRGVMEVTADDAFNRLARGGLVENTETNRRNFINQLGQYYKAAQNKLVLALRDSQVGPFSTAGTNYYIQKIRALTMNSGATSTSRSAEFRLRAEMLAKTLALIGLTVPIINKLLWGRWDGDDDTPFASIKIGTDANGRTKSIGLGNLIGFTGGLRQSGILAMIEGSRRGAPAGQSFDRAVENIAGSLLHPAEGPLVAFAHTAITGTNSLGMKLAERTPADESHAGRNLLEALRQANPIISAATGRHPGHRGETIPFGERVNQLAGPFGLQYRGGYVNDVQRRFNELSGQRTAQTQRGLPFEHEQEYQLMSRAHQRIIAIDQALKGQHKIGGRLRPGDVPAGQDREELLQLQRDVARSALGAR